MLTERRKNIKDCKSTSVLRIADFLCHDSPEVRPIFECVKVFARIHESGEFTYARHPFDLGTKVVTAEDVASRMRDLDRSRVVKEALHTVEQTCHELWPFAAGSSSWIQLELLHPLIRINADINEATIIFRKAVRLNSRGEQTATPLLERVFLTMQLPEACDNWRFAIDPTTFLVNTSGSGIYTDLREQFDGMFYLTEGEDVSTFKGLDDFAKKTLCEFSDKLLAKNFGEDISQNPGFYFKFEGTTYQVRSSKYSSIKKKERTLNQPLPILGIIR